MNLKKAIAKDLNEMLNHNCSIEQLSLWAEGVYSLHCRELDSETEEIINRISFMSNGPEFYLSKFEIERFARILLGE